MVAPHNVGGIISTKASVSLVFTLRNGKIVEHFNDFADPYVKNAGTNYPEVVDGYFSLPEGPGWGVEAVAKEGIRPIMFRQERGGIMAADGYSRTMMGKKFGVFACQGGPGAENSYGGIAQAFADSVPIMFIPDGIPLINSDVSPSFISSKNFTDITKWSKSINDSNRIVPLMKRAFHSLKNGRPSPVLIEMHRDHMTQEVSNFKQYNSPHQPI